MTLETPLPEASDPFLQKTLGGKHYVTKLLGQGAMGRVYLAEDLELRREVALKVISKKQGTDPIFTARFKREARALAAIGHPNVVQVLEVGWTECGEPYFVMELLKGRDLGSELNRCAPFSVYRAINIVGQVLFALAATHREGIVHRDLKPENIFLTSRSTSSWFDHRSKGEEDQELNFVKILDYGLSRFDRGGQGISELTVRHSIMGSPAYMSPEQIRDSSDVDGRADLYAVGTILFECLTGQPPLSGDTSDQLLHQVLYNKPVSVGNLRPELPIGLIEVIERSLSKDRTLRFQRADEFIEALRPFYHSSPPQGLDIHSDDDEPPTIGVAEDALNRSSIGLEPRYVEEYLPPTAVQRQPQFHETIHAPVPPPKKPFGRTGLPDSSDRNDALPAIAEGEEEDVLTTVSSHPNLEWKVASGDSTKRWQPWAMILVFLATFLAIVASTAAIVVFNFQPAEAEVQPQKVVMRQESR